MATSAPTTDRLRITRALRLCSYVSLTLAELDRRLAGDAGNALRFRRAAQLEEAQATRTGKQIRDRERRAERKGRR